jgi:hypothetical protein
LRPSHAARVSYISTKPEHPSSRSPMTTSQVKRSMHPKSIGHDMGLKWRRAPIKARCERQSHGGGNSECGLKRSSDCLPSMARTTSASLEFNHEWSKTIHGYIQTDINNCTNKHIHETPRYKSKHDAFTVLPLHTTTRHNCRATIYATWMATTRRST